MDNYELGPIIGKNGGGADVQEIPVDIVADGGTYSRVIMHTVHVPEGETWLIVLSGDLNPRYATSIGPEFFIGEVSIGPNLPRGRVGLAAEVTGTAEVTLKRNTGAGTDSFVGHVFTAPMPD